jgi:hypothetical protein
MASQIGWDGKAERSGKYDRDGAKPRVSRVGARHDFDAPSRPATSILSLIGRNFTLPTNESTQKLASNVKSPLALARPRSHERCANTYACGRS